MIDPKMKFWNNKPQMIEFRTYQNQPANTAFGLFDFEANDVSGSKKAPIEFCTATHQV